jgi:peptidase E
MDSRWTPAHGIDRILREAWERGIVLCGLSAGSLCWFAEGVSTFHGPPERIEGLGLLPWSNTVHYSSEPDRREAYHRWLRSGMRRGYAVDDGAALHFVGEELAQVVASRPDARAYRIEAHPDRVVPTQLATRFLGDPDVIPLVRPKLAEAMPA